MVLMKAAAEIQVLSTLDRNTLQVGRVDREANTCNYSFRLNNYMQDTNLSFGPLIA